MCFFHIKIWRRKKKEKFYYKKIDITGGQFITPQEWLASIVMWFCVHFREEINHPGYSHCFHMHSHLPVTDTNVSRRNGRCQKHFWLSYSQLAITQRSGKRKNLCNLKGSSKRENLTTSFHNASYIKNFWCFPNCLL